MSKTKTLIVHYLPRGERSNTKKLVDYFKAAADGRTEIVEHDLGENPPDMFLKDNLMAYVMRDYVGEHKPEYDELLKVFDANIEELKAADFVVLAFPMYNYSVPAVVKAWMDSVAFKGKTFDMNEGEGPMFKPLLSSKGLLLSTTGAPGYADPESPLARMDHARPLAVENMEFLGIDVTRIDADGANGLDQETYAGVLARAKSDIEALANRWYS